MTDPSADPSQVLREVSVDFGGRTVLISPRDALQIAHALQRYLDVHAETPDGVPLPRVAGSPWVDSRNTLRVGTWMLGVRSEGLVLSLRDLPAAGQRHGYVLVALLTRLDGEWSVTDIAVTRVTYR